MNIDITINIEDYKDNKLKYQMDYKNSMSVIQESYINCLSCILYAIW